VHRERNLVLMPSSTMRTTSQKFISLNVHHVDGCLKYKFPDGWIIFGKICRREVWVELLLRYELRTCWTRNPSYWPSVPKGTEFPWLASELKNANGLRVVRSELFILWFSCKERLKCWTALPFAESNVWFRFALGSVSGDRRWKYCLVKHWHVSRTA
jgi:hypothetical protein